MTMTVSELLAHAANLQGDLEHKRHQVASGGSRAYSRETLLCQIDALQSRVCEIIKQCAEMTDASRSYPPTAGAVVPARRH